MSEAKPFKTPYEIVMIEDIPGERYCAIGGEHVIFLRIPANHPRQLATVEFICRACNAHDALLAACEAAWNGLINFYGGQPPELVERLRAAIALAREPEAK